jgi:hypothetical protein
MIGLKIAFLLWFSPISVDTVHTYYTMWVGSPAAHRQTRCRSAGNALEFFRCPTHEPQGRHLRQQKVFPR